MHECMYTHTHTHTHTHTQHHNTHTHTQWKGRHTQHLADFLVSALPVNLDGQLKLHNKGVTGTLPFKVRPVGPAGDGKKED